MMRQIKKLTDGNHQRSKQAIATTLSLLPILFGIGCGDTQSSTVPVDDPVIEQGSTESEDLLPTPAIKPLTTTATLELLEYSWDIYKNRFIQADGRVIDREAQDRTVSEGQAYAMLRAVMMDDPDTFEATLEWAEENLARQDASGKKIDHLWAWQWGQKVGTAWGILDENFASDADLDAATALILASQRWERPDYLELAQIKLKDLWNLSTLEIPIAITEQGSKRYFLPGPSVAFQQGLVTYLNPSYFAPYAFRLFAAVDPDHNWLELVDTSYAALNQSASVSAIGLPSDWVGLDLVTGTYQPVGPLLPLKSVYSFDAFRVWWRVALDYLIFESPEAKDFLETYLPEVENQWQSNQFIAAVIDQNGQDTVEYGSTAQYAMLYTAFHIVNPAIANDIWIQKLFPAYNNGIWDNDTAYYTQNLVWFGLASTAELVPLWFSGANSLPKGRLSDDDFLDNSSDIDALGDDLLDDSSSGTDLLPLDDSSSSVDHSGVHASRVDVTELSADTKPLLSESTA